VHKAHFRLFGVPVRVEPFFVIVAALWGLDLEPLWLVFAFVVIAAVSVLVHEMGHALTYRYAGQRSAIVLHAFGGFTIPAGGGRRVLSKPMSIAVSLAGVATQLLLLWLPARLLRQTDWGLEQEIAWRFGDGGFNWWPVLSLLQFISLWWAIFNILPIRPLDGGHVMEELVGFENACKISIGAAAIAGLWVIREWGGLFGGLFFFLFAFLNYRDLKAGEHTGAFDVEAPDPGGGGTAPRGGGRSRGRGGGGRGGGGGGGRRPGRRRRGHLQPVPSMEDLSAELQSLTDTGDIETRAWNALRSGDGQRAGDLLKQAGTRLTNPFLQASVALAQGHDGLALDLFEAAYMAEPGGPPNLVPATVLSERGQAPALAATLVAQGPVGVEAAGSLQTHLHYAERFATAAEVGEQVFASGPRSPAQTAFEVACSWARAGKADEALRWVEAAVDAGFKAPGLLDGEPDLASVRAHPGWSAVRARLSA
jgi:stage IV sporulation protein FB